MEVQISKQGKMPLLSRERVTGFVHFEDKTPSRMDIKKALAHKIKAKEDMVVVRHIYQRFGEHKAKVIAHIYEDEKLMQQLEPANLLKKHSPAPKAEEKKEEAKAAE